MSAKKGSGKKPPQKADASVVSHERKPPRTASGDELSIQRNLTTVQGFQAWGAYTGVKKKRRDLALIYSEVPAAAAAVFDAVTRAARDFALAIRGPEGQEGTMAFIEKRDPAWARDDA